MTTFEKFGLADNLLQILNKENIETPTEIQEKSIPAVLDNRDIIATSATGSGKTLAFGLGLLHNLERTNNIQAIVLAPTRELAEQISMVLKQYGKPKGLRVVPIYGGVSFNPQANALRTADIVVATPGRCLDHMNQGTIDLSFVKHIVLDEADRMLDMGFLDDVKKIMSDCPKERQTLLFSATLPSEIMQLSKKFLNDPVKISVQNFVDPSKLTQVYYDVTNNLKISLLTHLIKEDAESHAMVFTNSRRYADIISNTLSDNKLKAATIHGGLSQAERKRVLDAFHEKKIKILVCTDIAARGLDIPTISHVYNYDIPNDTKQYIHRVGRTARAGKDGKVVNLISTRDYDNFSIVVRDNRDMDIKRVERPFIEQIASSDENNRRMGGGRSQSSRNGSQNRGYSSRGSGRDSQNNNRGPRVSYGNDRDGSRSMSSGRAPRRTDDGRSPRRDDSRSVPRVSRDNSRGNFEGRSDRRTPSREGRSESRGPRTGGFGASSSRDGTRTPSRRPQEGRSESRGPRTGGFGASSSREGTRTPSRRPQEGRSDFGSFNSSSRDGNKPMSKSRDGRSRPGTRNNR